MIRHSAGKLDNDGLSKIVFWIYTQDNPKAFTLPSVPIELDWKVLVTD
ncbi:hypothetical protein M0R72_00870 [Candidatus Pacearchaeota archaeon]|nr:hypothetical protein [Candidatus Pacearchaeota archaeon]